MKPGTRSKIAYGGIAVLACIVLAGRGHAQDSSDDPGDGSDTSTDAGDDPQNAPVRHSALDNITGTLIQGYIQQQTGNADLAAQAGQMAGEDADVAASNAEQLQANQQEQEEAEQLRQRVLAERQQQYSQSAQQPLPQQRSPLPQPAQPLQIGTVPSATNPTAAESGPKLDPGLNKSQCVQVVVRTDGRYLHNNCSVPINIAYCSDGPDQDGSQCSASEGQFGATFAISSINSLRPGGEASNTVVVGRNNKIPYFACANTDGRTQAMLTGLYPPQGICVRY